MNTSAENYFIEGCGRCPLGATPECKVHRWTEPLSVLRCIALNCGLTETCKWGVPCYTFNDKNICNISAFNEYCCISFFKGALLADDKNLLVAPGEHSQAVRMFKFGINDQPKSFSSLIRAYIFEAIEVEKAGLKIEFKKSPEPMPEELIEKMEDDPVFKSAFETLTPGRQRGYIFYFSQPKQAKTRISRIEKCEPMILSGIGLHDKYASKKK